MFCFSVALDSLSNDQANSMEQKQINQLEDKTQQGRRRQPRRWVNISLQSLVDDKGDYTVVEYFLSQSGDLG